MSIINLEDSYVIKLKDEVKNALGKEVVEFLFSISNLSNKKTSLDESFCVVSKERIDFIYTFMNEYLKIYNGQFKIKNIDDSLIIKIQLIKNLK